ncbi:hypothetical protein BGLA2_560004 [Burkholderia gladioli]|nr:hypothetical protein BGLA2_560004 [Burkholderia gladioli]
MNVQYDIPTPAAIKVAHTHPAKFPL